MKKLSAAPFHHLSGNSISFMKTVAIRNDIILGDERPVLIAGPCVIEDIDACRAEALALRDIAAKLQLPFIFKASFDKANRTSLDSFRGPGLQDGLAFLNSLRSEHGIAVTTDVHETQQVEAIAEAVDLIQVPALLCRQTDLVVACAKSGCATSIKKGQFLAPWDCGNIVDKFHNAGGQKLIMIERGTSFGYNTLVSDMRSLPLLRGLGVPVVYDGTHSVQAPGGMGTVSGGASHLAPTMLRCAMAAGVEGLFLETHPNPKDALSDGPNMIPLAELEGVLHDCLAIHNAIGRPKVPENCLRQ